MLLLWFLLGAYLKWGNITGLRNHNLFFFSEQIKRIAAKRFQLRGGGRLVFFFFPPVLSLVSSTWISIKAKWILGI